MIDYDNFLEQKRVSIAESGFNIDIDVLNAEIGKDQQLMFE